MMPTILTIFGVTGDLALRKLIPALSNLGKKGILPKVFRLVGFSRRELGVVDFQKLLGKYGKNFTRTSYVRGQFGDSEAYKTLGETLLAIDEELGLCSNKLFYLASSPEHFETILQNLAHSGLTIPCSDESGWTRVLVEKPFGRDFEGAGRLDTLLGLLFKEEQIFRIDHYLAKETIQNILTFRFSNELFEPLWTRGHIEKIEIRLFEKAGIKGRGAFYDAIGALRDVGQNHLLQMLAIIAMENPGILDASLIQKERARIFKALSPVSKENMTRGQYKGYKKETGVSNSSSTETYFRLRVFIDNERWRGIPFYLESGKGMRESKAEIVVYFKKTSVCLCPPKEEHGHQNVLTFQIQPNEGISLLFWSKKPGFEFELEPRSLSFLYKTPAVKEKIPDAYDRVLYDCIRGDQTLFTSTEEVNAAWQFITPILKIWERSEVPLVEYKKGQEIINL